MISHHDFMSYCIHAAKRAGKATKTNPMVGSVLVYNNKIIGEGIHERYGDSHAERNAINQALENYPDLIADATLYVTLEPCFHTGKTPPCVQYVLKNNIKKVVIGTVDPHPLVAGKSISLLKENNVEVEVGVMEEECKFLIRKFLTNITGRPYIVLKWAQSKDGFIGQKDKQVWLTNAYSKMLVHKWRSELDGIMVGTQTVITDNPSLTTREWPGDNPIRIVTDFKSRIPEHSKIFNDGIKTLVLTEKPDQGERHDEVKKLNAEQYNIESYWKVLFDEGINSILVEGGQKLIKSVLESNLWDEARIFTSPTVLTTGIKAPTLIGKLHQKQTLSGDLVVTILNDKA